MSNITFDVFWKDHGAKRGAEGLGDEVDGTSKKMSKFKAAAAAAAVAAGAALFKLGKDSVGAASDLNETISKTEQVFGSSAKSVLDFSKTSATSLGLSRQAALDGLSAFGNFFSQIKIGQGESVKMSKGLVQLSSDLASFNNADPAEVMEAFQSATRGEYDSLQKFLPTVNAAAIQTEALRRTHKKSVKDLTDADKATALYAIAQRDAGKAQGDFQRTSGGLANQQRILNAQFENAKAQLGQYLLPIMVKVTTAANKLLGQFIKHQKVIVPLVAALGTLVGVVWGINKAAKAYTAVQAALNIVMAANPVVLITLAIVGLIAVLVLAYKKSETFRKIVDGAFKGVLKAASGTFNWIKRNWPLILAIITGPIGIATLLVVRNWTKISNGAKAMKIAAVAAFKGVISWVKGMPGSISRSAGNMKRLLIGKGRDVITGFFDGLKAVWRKVTGWVGGLAGWIRDHKGPLSLDKKLLTPAGEAIMDGFTKGLTKKGSRALAYVKRLGGDVYNQINSLFGNFGFKGGGNNQNRAIGQQMAAAYGWVGSQWTALNNLIMGESGWNNNAQNPTSTAYGIFQFLNSTWAGVGARKTSDPAAQIAAGLRYIQRAYGNPLNAYNKWLSRSPHWYAKGGTIPEPIMGIGRSGQVYGFGERGQETVIPGVMKALSMSGLTGAAGGKMGLVVDSGITEMDHFIAELIRRFVRVRGGGNVQKALGKGTA